ncbi:MAG: DUF1517 domain-containing protein [Oscillatoriaceae bacterium SKW80]|nr:DUF1517 domain-containing protein [Oscillatoriaceae bacterium SKYG93]MCX8120978.1 DUF1517 domain-containing protein [Oscillatoriaceae bacterium SKW80]MDW8452251.1 DUF1517 domain-containing protein [Oscillatoriaceae cyanobacterium SKYGB_i_bin93]HIK26586.1 DUF1517 domain-containing protein [Oscillatoriaceae cyanobacterium M7585_C2015_266]
MGKKVFKSLLALALIFILAFSHADSALAARTGGRIGGGSFNIPSRSYSSPRSYSPGGYGGGYYPGGGGFGFPFLIPLFWGGGFGGVFSILIFIAIANFIVQSFRSSSEFSDELEYTNPTVSVAKVQVGLLAQARYLQAELNELARRADTGSPEGRAFVLQEASLALLRHPEYWVYAAAEAYQTHLQAAEAKFNQLSLAERSKFAEETLFNVNNQLRQTDVKVSPPGAEGKGKVSHELVLTEKANEYIVVTLLVAMQGKMELPEINNTEDLRQALRQIGSISSDRLMAFEVLWSPQAAGDTLTTDDMLAEYPNLKLV